MLIVSVVSASVIMLLEYLFGVTSVFGLAVIIVGIIGSYITIENIHNSFQKAKRKKSSKTFKL